MIQQRIFSQNRKYIKIEATGNERNMGSITMIPEKKELLEEPTEIIELIRSTPDTQRHRGIPDETLTEIRLVIEKHIKNTYFKKVQAPVGVKASLKA